MRHKRHIRFDWAMKRLLRNKANFAVLEGFLSELLKRDIKIIRIPESESNQDSINDKFNRVDLLAEDSLGQIFIIEIQINGELDYFHRMAYGTSKVITEYLDVGQEYKDIKKVYSVSIVYFDLGQGEDYVYYGTTDFYGIHKKDKLLLSESQKNKFNRIEPKDIFPEYYVLKVNSFNDIAKNTLDEWIYYLKNNEIKDSFKAKGLDKARKVLEYDKLEETDRKKYEWHLENLRYRASMLWSMKAEEEIRIREKAKQEGIGIGRKEEREKAKQEGIGIGRKEEREKAKQGILKMAKEMKEKGLDISFIAGLTGLTTEEIDKL